MKNINDVLEEGNDKIINITFNFFVNYYKI